MTTVLDKDIVKEALRELIREERDSFKTLLKEVFVEEQINTEDEFDRLLKKNFEQYEETFQALA